MLLNDSQAKLAGSHMGVSVSVFSRNAYRIRTEKRAAGYLLLSGDCNKKRRVYKVVVGSTLTQWISGFPC